VWRLCGDSAQPASAIATSAHVSASAIAEVRRPSASTQVPSRSRRIPARSISASPSERVTVTGHVRHGRSVGRCALPWHALNQLRDGAAVDLEIEADFVEQAQLVAEGQIEIRDGEAVPLGEDALVLGQQGQPPEQPRCQYSVIAYNTDLARDKWCEKEWKRLRKATRSAGISRRNIDRVIVFNRGMLVPRPLRPAGRATTRRGCSAIGSYISPTLLFARLIVVVASISKTTDAKSENRTGRSSTKGPRHLEPVLLLT
jgi:hypothetical protein